MKLILLTISLFILTISDRMHQDTPLKIERNGKISGLPNAFHPAVFDMENKYLRINDREIVFPECIHRYFDEFEQPELKLSASWYHSTESLPYYINFHISQTNENYAYKILVNLTTLELIYIHKAIRNGNSVSMIELELNEQCSADYKNKINRIK